MEKARQYYAFIYKEEGRNDESTSTLDPVTLAGAKRIANTRIRFAKGFRQKVTAIIIPGNSIVMSGGRYIGLSLEGEEVEVGYGVGSMIVGFRNHHAK